ncbi:MAG: hypothetical protein EBE86_015635 [Hormoscilla sp. GUM202]|nr:hypothetical protein [Hormoscilla sp. GUM202]
MKRRDRLSVHAIAHGPDIMRSPMHRPRHMRSHYRLHARPDYRSQNGPYVGPVYWGRDRLLVGGAHPTGSYPI